MTLPRREMEALIGGLLRSLKFAKFKEKNISFSGFSGFFPERERTRKKNMGRFVWNGNGREKNMGRFVWRLAKPKSNHINFRCVIYFSNCVKLNLEPVFQNILTRYFRSMSFVKHLRYEDLRVV